MGRKRCTTAITRRLLTDDERKNLFFSRFVRQENGCWLWTGAVCSDGYGIFKFNNRMQGIHRISYKIHRGEIPAGLNVNHTCDVRNCGNPDHLWIGTQYQNCLDKILKGRGARKLTKEQVLEIRDRTESSSFLGKFYGVDPALIGKIRRRERWAILPIDGESQSKDLITA